MLRAIYKAAGKVLTDRVVETTEQEIKKKQSGFRRSRKYVILTFVVGRLCMWED